jgi:predicted permease
MQVFLQNALLALRQVIMLYAIVGMGFAAERLRWFPETAARQATKLLLYVITPCMIVNSFLSMEYSAGALRGLLLALACGILLHAGSIAAAQPVFRKYRRPEDRVLHFAAIYGNCGYMGLPLAQAIVGKEGVFYGSVFILTFQVFAFTHGEYVMGGGKFRWQKLLLNAGVMSVAIGLPLFFTGAAVSELLAKPLGMVAAMNSPLAMLMFGAYLSNTKRKGMLRSRKIFAAGAIKLLAAPALMLVVLALLGVQGPLRQAMLISAAAPSANNTVVFAARHGRDAGYAAQVVGLFSILSIATMPLLIAIGQLG